LRGQAPRTLDVVSGPHALHEAPSASGKAARRTRALSIALGLNVGIVALQVVAGVVAHSLGLLADAAHNLTDILAIVASLAAVRWSLRQPTDKRSYGFHRTTILAALVNAVSILAVTVLIVVEGVRRLITPPEVSGGVVLVVALLAAAANGIAAVTVASTERHSHDLNMRSSLVHLAGDAAASLGVAAAGAVIWATGRFERLDPLVSLGIAVLLTIQAVSLLRQSVDVLLESTPGDLDVATLAGALGEMDGVEQVHDLHVWSLSSEVRALSAHLVLAGHPSLEEAQVVGERVKGELAHHYAIGHATLELECEPCQDVDPTCVLDDRPVN
jgi:cobalt-zinc-cadmium efflux system protein